MSGLGVHFAITEQMMNSLLSCNNDDLRIELIEEVFEEELDDAWKRETDKAWDAIHRCLTDGTLGFENGPMPLRMCILGGEQLSEDENYIISLVRPELISELADELQKITKDKLKEKYFAINPDDYDAEICEDDFEYTWDCFSDLQSLFKSASESGRAVLFTVY